MTDTCTFCGKEFQSVKNHRIASDTCPKPRQPNASSDDEPEGEQRTYSGYKDRYTAYYGKSWEDVRQRILERDDHRCQGCGLTHDEHRERDDLFPPGKGLHIHHKVPAKEFDGHDEANDIDNLVALCADCHRDAENGGTPWNE